jgi:hypothetical protein
MHLFSGDLINDLKLRIVCIGRSIQRQDSHTRLLHFKQNLYFVFDDVACEIL